MIADAAPKSDAPAQEPKYRDMPFYWFLRWDLATSRGDHDAANNAQRELKRLGYVVRRLGPRRRRCPA